MSSGAAARQHVRKGQQDVNSRLREIAAMLPVPNSLKGRTLTKQETLTYLLCYLKFLDKCIQELENSLSVDFIPRVCETEDAMRTDPSLPAESNRNLCSVREVPVGSRGGSPACSIFHSPGTPTVVLDDYMLGPCFSEDDGAESLALGSPVTQGSQLPLVPHSKPRECLNLSPSLFASPGKDLAHQLFPEGKEEQELQGLFEHVWLSPKPEAPDNAAWPRSSPSDLLREASKVYSEEKSSRSSGTIPHTQSPVLLVSKDRDDPSSQGDDKNFNCTPARSRPQRRGRHSNRKRRYNTRGRPRSQLSPKKKCINGFIMFCQINRKLYHRSYPGTPSSTVTKELASLWRVMSKQEQQVYCKKAWLFSRQQNRNVRMEYEA